MFLIENWFIGIALDRRDEISNIVTNLMKRKFIGLFRDLISLEIRGFNRALIWWNNTRWMG